MTTNFSVQAYKAIKTLLVFGYNRNKAFYEVAKAFGLTKDDVIKLAKLI